MSLVAYADTSDEESDDQSDIELPQSTKKPENHQSLLNGHISDDDSDDYIVDEPTTSSLSNVVVHRVKSLSLPKPKNQIATAQDDPNQQEEEHKTIATIFARLPMPKDTSKANEIIEEDDEFLHKKAIPLPDTENKKPSVSSTRATVKFTIPSMKDFADVDADLAKTKEQREIQTENSIKKRSGLLEVLPKAKSEQNFAKAASQDRVERISETVIEVGPSNAPLPSPTIPKMSNALIPDTVRNRRPATNTEGVDFSKPSTSKKAPKLEPVMKTKNSIVDFSDSEASDDDAGDFFALNDDEQLPEVNTNELHVLVAKRAAKIETAANKYLKSISPDSNGSDSAQQEDEMDIEESQRAAQKRNAELNDDALEALVGSKSKRRRQQKKEINIVELSGNEVLPDRNEWMRTALASSTSYQPTGVLVDEEPATGTRRKHQITYLAHKAKANEAELQAMWAANRQNRRATQSKYGF